MKNSYFLKKKISEIAKACGSFLVKALTRFCKFLLTKRTILFVTNQKIRSFTMGPLLQVCLILFFTWVGNLFIQSLRYNDIISTKAEEVSRLQSVNEYFEEEIENVNDKLSKINEYISSMNGGTHNVKAQEIQIKQPDNIKEEDLSRQDKHTMNQLNKAAGQLASIQVIAQERIKKIEGAIAVTGLNIKKMPPKSLQRRLEKVKEISLNDKRAIKGQGGPLHDIGVLDSMVEETASKDDLEGHLEKVKFTNEIDYLIALEKIISVMPFNKPMKNYYISSGFGTRVDPITGAMASHHGLDFVGVTNEKVVSPSKGKVILAGKFSSYGNAIVIDHGFGITTRYGHLSEVKVKEGQFVNQGDVIALQGNTGRSTGAHLHYEVRYRNAPLNPRKFLEAGDALFNDDKTVKHANS